MMGSILNAVGDIALVCVVAGFHTFVLLYSYLANWRETRMGRHVMLFMRVQALIMTYVAVASIFGPLPGREITLIVIYGSLAFVIWQRVILLVHEQRSARVERAHHGKHRSAQPPDSGIHP